MKLIKDYREEVLEKMVQNETLGKVGCNGYFVRENALNEDICHALTLRYGEKLNDYLYEPYGRARKSGREVNQVIDDAVDSFAEQILRDCEMLLVASPPKDDVIVRLRDSLDSRYR